MKNKLFNKTPLGEIFFLERSPFMSVELLDLLNDYKIICYNDDSVYKLLKKKWDLFSYLDIKFDKNLENDKAIEILLNDKSFLSKVIQNKKHSKALFFYMNQRMDELLKDINMSMLLPPYKVQEKLGNKLYLSNICEKLNITPNKSLIFKKIPRKLSGIFARCQKILGVPFIAQGSLGVSGEDTFLINTEKELEKAAKDLQNGLKVAKYISNNIPVSVHLCISHDQIIIQGPFIQLLGFSELSAKPFQFAGNDTNQSLFNQDFIDEVRDMSFRIGVYVKNEGYRGIFGIDYLWDKDTGAIYPQELNTRFVGLTRLLTGIQKDQSVFPDLLKHIGIFNAPNYSDKCKHLNSKNINFSQYNYSQVIIYNNLPHTTIVSRRIEPSIYQAKNDTLRMVKPSLFMHDMGNNEILITQTAHKDQKIDPGGMIAKIILKRSAVLNGEYKLEPKVVEIIGLIRKHIIDTYA